MLAACTTEDGSQSAEGNSDSDPGPEVASWVNQTIMRLWLLAPTLRVNWNRSCSHR
jgi:hypothetical protein